MKEALAAPARWMRGGSLYYEGRLGGGSTKAKGKPVTGRDEVHWGQGKRKIPTWAGKTGKAQKKKWNWGSRKNTHWNVGVKQKTGKRRNTHLIKKMP